MLLCNSAYWHKNIRLWTYASHFFKESTVAAEVDELLVEEPGELELQRRVVAHLAGQDHALPHGDVQRGRQRGDGGRLWKHTHAPRTSDQNTLYRPPSYPPRITVQHRMSGLQKNK